MPSPPPWRRGPPSRRTRRRRPWRPSVSASASSWTAPPSPTGSRASPPPTPTRPSSTPTTRRFARCARSEPRTKSERRRRRRWERWCGPSRSTTRWRGLRRGPNRERPPRGTTRTESSGAPGGSDQPEAKVRVTTRTRMARSIPRPSRSSPPTSAGTEPAGRSSRRRRPRLGSSTLGVRTASASSRIPRSAGWARRGSDAPPRLITRKPTRRW
mmetsp:Transcript_4788/g.17918  ORF Transcript_4788/g.17918 Transcript_4788/m.17918 type:complete len:213 (-) Transcript_4788:1087-1725(-)